MRGKAPLANARSLFGTSIERYRAYLTHLPFINPSIHWPPYFDCLSHFPSSLLTSRVYKALQSFGKVTNYQGIQSKLSTHHVWSRGYGIGLLIVRDWEN